MGRRKTTDQFKEEMKNVNPNIEVLGEYIGSKDKILVRNRICNHEWKSQPSNLLLGCGCPTCVGKNKTTEQFKNELKQINPNIIVLGEYINAKTKILVKDKRCSHEWNSANPHNLLNGFGCPECARLKRIIDRTGEIKYSNKKEKMTIIKYNNAIDINILFEDGTIVKHRSYEDFKNGDITNPNYKSLYGVGYLGEGDYVAGLNYKFTPQYNAWSKMIRRCYDKNHIKRYPTYEGCTVSEEWLCFQTFAKWFDDNYYEIEGEQMHLDKDILHKGNKVYSSETCVFAPHKINTLFETRKKSRGEYPIGVSFHKQTNKFKADCQDTFLRKTIYIGEYLSSEDAFRAYKNYKEKHIKKVADYYKDRIPQKLYDAMYKYKVEITD